MLVSYYVKYACLIHRKGEKCQMNIAIFDKSLDYQVKIKKLIIENYAVADDPLMIHCYDDMAQLLKDNKDEFFHIAFIDVTELGLSVAQRLRKTNSTCIIIMMYKNYDYIEEAFQVYAADYLVKPFDNKKFNGIFQYILEGYYEQNVKFIIPIRDMGRKRFFMVDEIRYVETYYNDIEIVTVDGKHYVTHVKNRYHMRAILKPRWFMQVNQSVLVNMKYIDYFTDQNVILKTREVFVASRLTLIENHLKYQSFLKKYKIRGEEK